MNMLIEDEFEGFRPFPSLSWSTLRTLADWRGFSPFRPIFVSQTVPIILILRRMQTCIRPFLIAAPRYRHSKALRREDPLGPPLEGSVATQVPGFSLCQGTCGGRILLSWSRPAACIAGRSFYLPDSAPARRDTAGSRGGRL